MMPKLIIVTAPSGAGKTTIVHHLLHTMPTKLAFSVSATTRSKRSHEKDGEDYYFLSVESFRQKIAANDFVEWEEVYEDLFYGTLKSEIERIWAEGKNIIFDIDVKGAVNLKRAYPQESLTVFVKPPSAEILFERLRNRNTESEDSFNKRIARVAEELTYENRFDKVLINDDLVTTLKEAEEIVSNFL